MPISTVAAVNAANAFKPSVFSKLDSNDPQRVADGSENLQYPSDLGTDEYNQFVLFTMFEKDTAEITTKLQEVRGLRNNLNILQNSDIEEFARQFAEYYDGDPSNPLVQGAAYGANFLADVGDKIGDWWSGYRRDQIDTLKDRITTSEAEITRLRQELDDKADSQFKQSTNSSAFTQFNRLGIKDRRAPNRSSVGRTRFSSATEQVKKSIALYIPNKLVNNGSITYSNVDFDVVRQGQQLLKGDFSSLAPTFLRKGAGLLDTVSGFFGADVNSREAIQAVTGLVINPRTQQVFQNANTRSFDFTFSLAPQTPEEAVTVNKIIRAFREYSHPALDSTSFFLKVPAEFEIRYYKIFGGNGSGEVVAENLFLNKIGRCALTSINVDYTPNGINSTFHDGSPVRTTITMTFTELRPLTRQDIEEGF